MRERKRERERERDDRGGHRAVSGGANRGGLTDPQYSQSAANDPRDRSIQSP